jgi:hypothetical protein
VFPEPFVTAAVYSCLLRICRIATDVVPLFLSKPLPRNESIRHSIIYIACRCPKHLNSKTGLHKIQLSLPVSPSWNHAHTPSAPLKLTPILVYYLLFLSVFQPCQCGPSHFSSTFFVSLKNFPSHSGLFHFNHAGILPSSAFSSRSVLPPRADHREPTRHAQQHKLRSVLTQAVMFLPCFREVPSSNLC